MAGGEASESLGSTSRGSRRCADYEKIAHESQTTTIGLNPNQFAIAYDELKRRSSALPRLWPSFSPLMTGHGSGREFPEL